MAEPRISPPWPVDEPSRLAALRRYRILDTEPEPIFDRITRLASKLLGMPVSLISLVDETRQWFKARHGLAAPWTRRDLAFCAYTILGHDPMVVPDAVSDERFAENPMVTGEPHIRFYAGAPLKTPEGHILGTLCVIDRHPHADFDADKQTMLQDLAELAMAEIERRHLLLELKDTLERRDIAEAARRESDERLRLAVETAMIGTWEWNLMSGELIWSPRSREIFGVSMETPLTVDDFVAAIHPEDRPEVVTRITAALRGGKQAGPTSEYRIVRPDGDVRWISGHGGILAERDADGKPQRLIGVLRDITERKKSETMLTASLAEKDMLLRELHHRVKNNLQSIWGMLQVEATRYPRNVELHDRLEAISQRINFLGQIHQQLYASGDFCRVDMSHQLRQLVASLAALYTDDERITVTLEAEPLYCDLDLALPLGLIANELITNSLKHARPAGPRASIRVFLVRAGNIVEFGVVDNGVGHSDAEPTHGIGLTLIHALVGQIAAEIETQRADGWRTMVRLPAAQFQE